MKNCLLCVRKHLAKAECYHNEAVDGYGSHEWHTIGELGLAEDECTVEYPELAAKIRRLRVRYMEHLGAPENFKGAVVSDYESWDAYVPVPEKTNEIMELIDEASLLYAAAQGVPMALQARYDHNNGRIKHGALADGN